MGFTDLTFSVGQKLTSTILSQVDQNFDALAEGDTSAPRVPRPVVWGQFCGFSTANAGIYASKGLSSFTRNAVGDYTIAFTTPFSGTNTDYLGVNLGFDHNTSQAGDTFIRNANVNSLGLSECTFRCVKAATSSTPIPAEDANSIWISFWDYS